MYPSAVLEVPAPDVLTHDSMASILFSHDNSRLEEGSLIESSFFLDFPGGSRGVDDIDECRVESDSSELSTFNSKTWILSIKGGHRSWNRILHKWHT